MATMEEVTATQAAVLTGLSERTIRRKIASGELHARRVAANRFAIRVGDLPKGYHAEALAARVTALERRVEALERALRENQPDEDTAQDVPEATFRQALAELASEVARLAPLVGATGDVAETAAEAPPRQRRDAEG